MLSGMVCQYASLGFADKAYSYLLELEASKNTFLDFLKKENSVHCLMFPEDDADAKELVTAERAKEYYNAAKNAYERAVLNN